MIIQCDHCSAKFKMDDSKLANGPVKVRCAKCKEVFVVQKEEEPVEPTPQVTEPAYTGEAKAESEPGNDIFGQTAGAGDLTGAADEGAFSFNDSESTLVSDKTQGDESAAPNEFDWNDSPAFSGATGSSDMDLTGFSGAAAQQDSDDTGENTGGGDFDFGDVQIQSDFSGQVSQEPATAGGAQEEFSMDFGDVSFSDTPAEGEPSSQEFSFSSDIQDSIKTDFAASDSSLNSGDAAGGDFTFSFDTAESAPAKDETSPAAAAGAVNFGEFDFGEVDSQPPVRLESPPVMEKKQPAGNFESVPDHTFLPVQDEELPPTSLSTRKKRGSLFPLFVILGAIVLIVALAGSGIYFFGGPKAFSKVGLGFLVEWYDAKGVEEGNISLKNLKAEYVVSKEAGEIFVVRGEAVNNFKKPRASIQVKLTILGNGGASLKARTAFCGNSLSNEQLVTIPFAKIEEIMNNQFGDSLANLGVKPGAAIPFVVVVNQVPKEALDYSVQVSGSTVAAQ